jgi:hypothetical protein
VAGVFPAACIVETESGDLITLVMASTGNLPGGIVIDAPRGFAFDAINLGAAVAARGGLLRFAPGDLVIDLRPAHPWRSNLGALGLDLARESSRRAWRATADLLAADERAAPFIGFAGESIDALASAACVFDGGAAHDAVARLVGLGAGTTPAGDDFLVGLLGGLWASAGSDPSRRAFATRGGEAIAASVDRTSHASRTYLLAAAVGEVSERLTDLIAALASASQEATVAATRAALAVGHSSGACGVLGLLIGTGAWDAPSPVATLIEVAATSEPYPPGSDVARASAPLLG